MPEIIKINVDGEERNAIEMPFEIVKEDWAEYEFADGGRVRLKTTMIKVLALVDAEGAYLRDPVGDRILSVSHNTLVVASG